MFRQIKDPKHPLHYLLPPVKVSHSQMVLRPTYPYQIPLAKTSRRGRDFVNHTYPTHKVRRMPVAVAVLYRRTHFGPVHILVVSNINV